MEEAAALLRPPDNIIAEEIYFFFFPESPLAPRLLDLVAKAKSLGLTWIEGDCQASISTTGRAFVRDQTGLDLLKAVNKYGINKFQLTLHGLEPLHDWFTRRKGSFQEILHAAELIYAEGCTIGWQIFVNKKNLGQVEELKELIRGISPEGRFEINPAIPTYIGNALEIDDLRLERTDLDRLSTSDRELLLQRYKPETEHISRLLDGEMLKFEWDFEFPEVIVKPDGTVIRANYAYEPIGSLKERSLREIITNYRQKTPREQIMASWEHRALAEQFGDRECTKLYTPYCVWIKWLEKMFSSLPGPWPASGSNV